MNSLFSEEDDKEKRRKKHNRKVHYHEQERDHKFNDGGRKRKIDPYKRHNKKYDDEDYLDE